MNIYRYFWELCEKIGNNIRISLSRQITYSDICSIYFFLLVLGSKKGRSLLLLLSQLFYFKFNAICLFHASYIPRVYNRAWHRIETEFVFSDQWMHDNLTQVRSDLTRLKFWVASHTVIFFQNHHRILLEKSTCFFCHYYA